MITIKHSKFNNIRNNVVSLELRNVTVKIKLNGYLTTTYKKVNFKLEGNSIYVNGFEYELDKIEEVQIEN